MKDRNAVTTQWFSVQMPGREAPDWQQGLLSKNLASVQISKNIATTENSNAGP